MLVFGRLLLRVHLCNISVVLTFRTEVADFEVGATCAVGVDLESPLTWRVGHPCRDAVLFRAAPVVLLVVVTSEAKRASCLLHDCFIQLNALVCNSDVRSIQGTHVTS